MSKPKPPTGAQLYKRWMLGERLCDLSHFGFGYVSYQDVVDIIRAYLRRRDARRRGK